MVMSFKGNIKFWLLMGVGIILLVGIVIWTISFFGIGANDDTWEEFDVFEDVNEDVNDETDYDCDTLCIKGDERYCTEKLVYQDDAGSDVEVENCKVYQEDVLGLAGFIHCYDNDGEPLSCLKN